METFDIISVTPAKPFETIRLRSARFAQSKTIPNNPDIDLIVDVAIKWLKDNGHNVIGTAEERGQDIPRIIVAPINHSFKPLK